MPGGGRKAFRASGFTGRFKVSADAEHAIVRSIAKPSSRNFTADLLDVQVINALGGLRVHRSEILSVGRTAGPCLELASQRQHPAVARGRTGRNGKHAETEVAGRGCSGAISHIPIQPAKPPLARNACSAGVDTLPRMALRCGKRPNWRMISRCPIAWPRKGSPSVWLSLTDRS